MKYTIEQQLNIGRQIYTHEISAKDATIKYDIALSTAQLFQTKYKKANGISLRNSESKHQTSFHKAKSIDSLDIDAYMSMSKEELIDELIRAKVNEARAKKGYEVKGVGANKVYNSISNKNSKS